MIGVRWRKVVRDLTHLRARTALVVLSIAIGVFAVGTIAGSQAALDASLRDGYERAQSANLIVYTTVPFDEGLVDSIRQIPGVGIAEGRRTVSVRVRTGETWRELQLTGIDAWDDQHVDVVIPLDGEPEPRLLGLGSKVVLQPAVAVIPFEGRLVEPAYGVVGEMLADSVISKLSTGSALRVISQIGRAHV